MINSVIWIGAAGRFSSELAYIEARESFEKSFGEPKIRWPITGVDG